MAFTATITNIVMQNDQFNVTVNFADSVTAWSTTKGYSFPSATTSAQAQSQITADGTAYKASLAAYTNVLAKVGTVITI